VAGQAGLRVQRLGAIERRRLRGHGAQAEARDRFRLSRAAGARDVRGIRLRAHGGLDARDRGHERVARGAGFSTDATSACASAANFTCSSYSSALTTVPPCTARA
jgi:hypothetical protein